MNHFPVISSILSPASILHFVQERYGPEKTTECRLLKAGVNHSYVLNGDKTSYVFRVYSLDWRTKSEILEEIRLLNILKTHDISVSYPLPDLQDNYIQDLNAPEGNRFAVLFTFAEGHKIEHLSRESHRDVGVLMAGIHKATEGLELKRVNYTPELLLTNSLNHLRKFLPEGEEMEFMRSTQAYLLDEFKNISEQEMRRGVVHLDIWFDNLNISTENKITLFDFDFCGNGYLCLDIAYFIMQLNFLERDENECRSKTEHFLQGYESVTKLSAEEKRLIPMLGVSLYFFYLGVQCSRFDNWSNSFLNEAYLKAYINRIIKRYYNMYMVKAG